MRVIVIVVCVCTYAMSGSLKGLSGGLGSCDECVSRTVFFFFACATPYNRQIQTTIVIQGASALLLLRNGIVTRYAIAGLVSVAILAQVCQPTGFQSI